MKLGAHISPIARNHIESADVVFSLMSHGIVEQWIEQLNSDVRSLQPYYEVGKSRAKTYREMIAVIVDEVKSGKKVVSAFYGHPGVFAKVPHDSVKLVKQLGFEAWLEPGISAESCLYADLGVDPGKFGCQHYETSQFMFYKRHIDTAAYLVLWQVGMAGDKSLAKYTTDGRYRGELVKLLAEYYPLEHEVILYEAAVLPMDKVRVEQVKINRLSNIDVSQQTTLVIPPATQMKKNLNLLKRLAIIDTNHLTLVTNK